ncbi:hypothetical protein Ddye_024356 [Dipteronia dyeriana]|uniref:Uncharacterized protein n=1 Tax=Dipteronia dyeriana TaxID=168575 RepID=A0AAD9TVQ4_9ROSI|nr:hypothetical protein Ddye_024356 [Dipteronia dyeriana]
MTLKMGIETHLRDKIPNFLEVGQILDIETGLKLNEETVKKLLVEIRPYLSGPEVEYLSWFRSMTMLSKFG